MRWTADACLTWTWLSEGCADSSSSGCAAGLASLSSSFFLSSLSVAGAVAAWWARMLAIRSLVLPLALRPCALARDCSAALCTSRTIAS